MGRWRDGEMEVYVIKLAYSKAFSGQDSTTF